MVWQQLLAAAIGAVLSMLPAAGPTDGSGHAFPVVGPTDYADAHHDYPATDIFADCGSTVVAPAAGVVLEVGRVDRWQPETDVGAHRGGKFFSIRGDDGVRYYGSHLSRLRSDIRPGDHVEAGEHLGRVGRTGSARHTPCHLHFGLSPVCQGTGQWSIRRGVVSPYRYLTRWESGRQRSPAGAIAAWSREHGCPATGDWARR